MPGHLGRAGDVALDQFRPSQSSRAYTSGVADREEKQEAGWHPLHGRHTPVRRLVRRGRQVDCDVEKPKKHQHLGQQSPHSGGRAEA